MLQNNYVNFASIIVISRGKRRIIIVNRHNVLKPLSHHNMCNTKKNCDNKSNKLAAISTIKLGYNKN